MICCLVFLGLLVLRFFDLILNGQFDNSFGQEEQDGKQTRFFWIFVNFVS